MTAKPRQSLLHLQMGQEVVYLILAISVVTAFVLVAYVFALKSDLAAAKSVLGGNNPSSLTQQVIDLTRENRRLRAEIADRTNESRNQGKTKTELKEQITRLKTRLTLAKTRANSLDKPPIVTLEETKGYKFKTGSAALTVSFRAKLREQVIPRLLQYGARYNVQVIEIVGHTDEQPVKQRVSNLDMNLLSYLYGKDARALQATDNVGLGMARAATVVRELIKDGRLAMFRVLPLSAGQAIELDQRLARDGGPVDARERRRIEIRMRRPD